MGWKPDEFWSATPYELSNAYIGHCKRHNLGKWAPDSSGHSRAETERFTASLKKLKERFPDGRPPKLSKAEKRALRGGHH